MASKKKIAGIAGLFLIALALIGAGAGATFTDSVAAAQQVATGSMNVTIAPKTSSDGVSQGSKTVALPAEGPLGSVFSTAPRSVVITNQGTITASAIRLDLTDSNAANDSALTAGLSVVVTSCNPTCGTPGNTPVTVYSGPVSGLLGHPIAVAGSLAPGATDGFTVSFATTDQSAGLPDAAQGETFASRVTVSYTG